MSSEGRRWVFVLAAVLMPLGCGSGDGGSLLPATTCSGDFAACGGDPTGTWDIVGFCVEGDLTKALNLQMANEASACANIMSNASMEGGGSVTYGAGTVSYDGKFLMKFTASYTPTCVSALAAGASLTSTACDQIETGLNKESGNGGTCSFTGGNCVCQLTTTTTVDQTRSYTVSGTTISEVDSDSYSFCVNGKTMSQQESIGGDVHGVTQLKKR